MLMWINFLFRLYMLTTFVVYGNGWLIQNLVGGKIQIDCSVGQITTSERENKNCMNKRFMQICVVLFCFISSLCLFCDSLMNTFSQTFAKFFRAKFNDTLLYTFWKILIFNFSYYTINTSFALEIHRDLKQTQKIFQIYQTNFCLLRSTEI